MALMAAFSRPRLKLEIVGGGVFAPDPDRTIGAHSAPSHYLSLYGLLRGKGRLEGEGNGKGRGGGEDTLGYERKGGKRI